MSTGKAVGVHVGGVLVGAAAGVATVTALGVAAAATVALMNAALKAALDAKKKAEIEKRQREIAALQEELEAGKRAAESFAENAKTWRLEARCKALSARLDRVQTRAAAVSDTTPPRETPAHPVAPGADSAELAREVARLEEQLREQEDTLRKAITGALETHTAKQGGIDAIDRLAALPAPPLDKPADLLGYLEETEALQRDKRNETALKVLRVSLHRALNALPVGIPHATIEEIGNRVADFSRAQDEHRASTEYRRVLELIERAQADARAVEPLRARIAKACEVAADLVYSQLPEADQKLLADEDAVPDAMEMARIEERLREATASDAARIADQQRRLAMAATLDALQSLGYETSVVDETTWFRNGSMFISRPEWGGFVVRLTPHEGAFVFYAGRYVDDGSWREEEAPITPEMEKFYREKIDDWRKVYLPRLVEALGQRNIVLSVHETESAVSAIQPVAREEIGDAMASQIETRSDEKEHRGGGAARAREA